jgi:hypothetical protein
MTSITNPRLLYLKAVLFLFTGLLSAVLLILELPTLKITLLLALAVWCFCRAYYFAFYVIEHYVDAGLPVFRFGIVPPLSPEKARGQRFQASLADRPSEPVS